MTATVPVPTPPVRKVLARLLGRRRQAPPQASGLSAVSGVSAASGALFASGGPVAPVPVVSAPVATVPDVPGPGPGTPGVEPGPTAPAVWLAALRLGS